MAKRSFRDRFFTRRTAESIMSPLGIVLFGAASAASIVAGLPLAAAFGVGALAWGGRVVAGMPRDAAGGRVEPATLSEPWRGYVASAQDAKRRFDRVVASVVAGPLRTRLEQLSARLDEGIDESWRIARRGHEVAAAVAQIDTTSARTELAELQAADRSPSTDRTMASLEAQLASAQRLQTLAERSRDRLRLLDARFDELVARAVEVSVGAGDTDLLGDDVDGLVSELEALRIALEETEQAAGPGTMQLPS
jgi:hypothetical protein